LALALLASWTAFAGYHWAWQPLRKQAALLRIGAILYDNRPVLLVGDSIVAAMPVCSGAVNLGVPGSKASDLNADYAAAIAARHPAQVITLIGINDLRGGSGPGETASGVVKFVLFYGGSPILSRPTRCDC
jgi:hypothetical protein